MGDKKKAYCYRGHQLTPDNIRTNGEGFRQCRICYNERVRDRRKQLREALQTIADFPMPDGYIECMNAFVVVRRIASDAIRRKPGIPRGRKWGANV